LVVGLFGAAGPPLIIFSASINLEKNVTRGTVAFCDVVVNTCRVAAFAIALWSRRGRGPDAAEEGDRGSGSELESFSNGEWTLLCTCVTTGALCGLGVGNLLADRVNQFCFKYILLTILAGGAVMLASAGMSGRQMGEMVAAEIAVGATSVLAVYYYFRRPVRLSSSGGAGSKVGALEDGLQIGGGMIQLATLLSALSPLHNIQQQAQYSTVPTTEPSNNGRSP
jgi:hypothetical protein